MHRRKGAGPPCLDFLRSPRETGDGMGRTAAPLHPLLIGRVSALEVQEDLENDLKQAAGRIIGRVEQASPSARMEVGQRVRLGHEVLEIFFGVELSLIVPRVQRVSDGAVRVGEPIALDGAASGRTDLDCLPLCDGLPRVYRLPLRGVARATRLCRGLAVPGLHHMREFVRHLFLRGVGRVEHHILPTRAGPHPCPLQDLWSVVRPNAGEVLSECSLHLGLVRDGRTAVARTVVHRALRQHVPTKSCRGGPQRRRARHRPRHQDSMDSFAGASVSVP